MSITRRNIAILAGAITVAVASAAFGYWLRGFMAEDGCLDAGGRWNHAYNFCERLITEVEAYPGAGDPDGGNPTPSN
jgi:hypothetical protein